MDRRPREGRAAGDHGGMTRAMLRAVCCPAAGVPVASPDHARDAPEQRGERLEGLADQTSGTADRHAGFGAGGMERSAGFRGFRCMFELQRRFVHLRGGSTAPTVTCVAGATRFDLELRDGAALPDEGRVAVPTTRPSLRRIRTGWEPRCHDNPSAESPQLDVARLEGSRTGQLRYPEDRFGLPFDDLDASDAHLPAGLLQEHARACREPC